MVQIAMIPGDTAETGQVTLRLATGGFVAVIVIM
jgi:hypothetical protein